MMTLTDLVKDQHPATLVHSTHAPRLWSVASQVFDKIGNDRDRLGFMLETIDFFAWVQAHAPIQEPRSLGWVEETLPERDTTPGGPRELWGTLIEQIGYES